MSEPVLVIEDVKKTFKIGFARKVVEAVRGISFGVERGEIFGFLGPNGAGKTTTIKMCMDLIRPSGGSIRLFGLPPGSVEARRSVGYLPEQPYFYDYLKPGEILDFFGRLHGLSRPERKRRSGELLSLVGLSHAADRTLRRFSKGMLQRVGLAQALVGDPELVVLDEPLSGLDPIGRKEVKEIISSLKQRGKTIFFSSHILSDIELLCDRIAIIDRGKLRAAGPIRDFLHAEQSEVEIIASAVSDGLRTEVSALARSVQVLGRNVKIICDSQRSTALVEKLVKGAAAVESVVPRSETLEEIFVRMAQRKEGGMAR
jgi:ABC-2 type transport system ATP-binding protein